MGWINYPLIFLISFFVCLVRPQVDIHERSEYVTAKNPSVATDDDNKLDKEIYTSMYELIKFFEREQEYVEDIRIIMD